MTSTTISGRWPLAFLLSVLLVPSDVRCQSTDDTGTQDDAAERTGPVFERGRLTLRLQAGSLSYEPVASMPGLEGSGVLNLSLSAFPEASRVVGIDLEFLGVARDYPNDFRTAFPIAGTDVNDRTDLSTSMLGAGLRLQLPPRSRLRAYGSIGYGYVWHTIELDGTFIGLPVSYREQKDSDWAPWVGAGVEFYFGAWGVSLDYRRFSSSATFGEPFDVPAAELGGSAILAGVAWQPGTARHPGR
jgi:hypothetical protein